MFTRQEFHKILIELYDKKGQTVTLEDVGKLFGIRGDSIRYHIRKIDGYENCPDVFRTIQKPLHCFEQIDEKSAYWLGYLMADGCLAASPSKNSYRLMLECKVEDKEILEKFCEFLDIRKNRITSGHKGRSVALSMAETNFTISPRFYGIIPNKSHKENTLPSFCKNQKLFFQYFKGLIDGDGTICTSRNAPGIMLVSNSKTMLKQIKVELKKYLPEPKSIWIMERTAEQQKGKKATQSIFTLKVGTGIKTAPI